MDRDAGICKSGTPTLPRAKTCQVRGAELLSSDVCKVNNIEECWWLLMCVRIQFKSCVLINLIWFKSPADQTTIIFQKDIVLLFWIFDDIPKMMHNLK